MAQSVRQNNLFAAEDIDVIVRSFSEINFTSYDFDTIKQSMLTYLNNNFPEEFNDYIESSEFIAIVELLAYLGQLVSFRADINARENFLDTAERKESVLRIAKQLNYKIKRNLPAAGTLKILSVQTNENVSDSLGNDLSNIPVVWDDPSNEDYQEQFLTVLNAAFASQNQFGTPFKKGTVGGIKTELYPLDNVTRVNVVYPYTTAISNDTISMELVNPNFVDGQYLYEEKPDPEAAFKLIYMNDGLGNSSDNTGFFLYTKQGTLKNEDFQIDNPLPNRVLNVTDDNINDLDVYFQEIDSEGSVKGQWEKVSNVSGNNIIFNNIDSATRTIYETDTLANGGIQIKFGDGIFANTPAGTYRLWYRTSENKKYSIRPDEFGEKSVSIPYVSKTGETHLLTITYELNYTISNAVVAETIADVKVRAPQTFYTQDRMVSSMDYNVYPLIKSNDIKKIKSINRTHAGHSRFIDINDPTGTIANTNVFGKDGIMYKEANQQEKTATFDTNLNIEQLIKKHIESMMGHDSLTNFFYETYRNSILSVSPDKLTLQGNERLKFRTGQSQATSNVGKLEPAFGNPTNWTTLGLDADDKFKLIRELCVLEYVNAVTNKTENVVVQNITSRTDDTGHVITLKRNVPDESRITRIIPVFRRIFNTAELDAIEEQIIQSNTFGIAYDFETTSGTPAFRIVNENDLAPEQTVAFDYRSDVTSNNLDSSWMVKCQYIGNNQYRITSRGVRYIFESNEETRFFFNNEFKTVDTSTGTSKKDTISVLSTNLDNKKQLEYVQVLNPGIGYIDNSQIEISVANNDGVSVTSNFTAYLGLNDVRIGESSNAWNPGGTITQNSASFNNTTHIIQNRYKNDGTSDETDSYTALTTSQPFYIDNGTDAYDGSKPFSRTAKILVSFDGSNNIETVSVLDAGAGYTNINNIAIRAKTGNTFGMNDAIDIPMLTFDSGSILNIESGTEALGKKYDDSASITIDGPTATLPGYLNNASKQATASLVLDNVTKLEQEVDFDIVDNFIYEDGYQDPRKIVVKPSDTDDDNVPDLPLSFENIINDADYVFFESYTDFDGYTYYRPVNGDSTKKVVVVNEDNSASPGTISTTLNTLNFVTATDGTDIIAFNKYDRRFYKFAGTVGSQATTILPQENDSLDTGIYTQNNVDTFYRAYKGRGYVSYSTNIKAPDCETNTFFFNHKHFAPANQRVDPSVSNVIDMYILTDTYHTSVRNWLSKNEDISVFPIQPTSEELYNSFNTLGDNKAISDQLVFRPSKFKLLFGANADSEYRCKFKVIKVPGTKFSDNEIKSKVISAVNVYFDVANWDFGETFYYTELSAYIHRELSGIISSVVIVPENQSSRFGNLFQIKATSEELFLSTARVTDVEIVKGYTEQNLRIGFTSSDDEETQTITTSSNTTTSVGPYAVYGTENSGGSANGQVGYFYPLYLTSDAALSASTTNAIHVHSFVEFPGVSFYMPTEQMNHGKTTFDTSLYTLYTTDTNTSTTITNSSSSGSSGNGGSGSGY